jgi:cellulose synthase/poly-beta-1,6-N-acetylglucosamine synthase-like glycosyltransferase
MQKSDDILTILILTHDEELHIARCITSALQISKSVIVVDSGIGTTSEICREMSVPVWIKSFPTFSEKLNWSLENLPIKTPWVLRLDADEILTEDFIECIVAVLADLPADVTGCYVRRQLWFLGQWIKHGGLYPTYSMRLWRSGSVYCEHRPLDEHMLLRRGTSVVVDLDIIDDPLTSFEIWVQKHVRYSQLELVNQEMNEYEQQVKPVFFGSQEQRNRWLKIYIYSAVPLFVRPTLYFFYRYFIRLGFLDGRRGFLFHLMHAFWYRLLVDARVYANKLRRE